MMLFTIMRMLAAIMIEIVTSVFYAVQCHAVAQVDVDASVDVDVDGGGGDDDDDVIPPATIHGNKCAEIFLIASTQDTHF